MAGDGWGVGNKADAEAFDKVFMGRPDRGRQYDLIFGEHPHSRRDNNEYVRTPDGEILDFDGFRRLIDVTIESSNYLKESGLSGDQIRKEVIGRIFCDGEQVYEFFARDPQYALRRADRLIDELGSVSGGWLRKSDREKLIGRKIYYMQHPATISRTIVDQGCIIIEMEAGWQPPEYTYDDNGLGEKYRESWYEDYKNPDGTYSIKTEIITPEIWWFRDNK